MYGQYGHPDSAAAAAAAEMQGLSRVVTRAAAGVTDQAYVQQQAALQALQVNMAVVAPGSPGGNLLSCLLMLFQA